MDTLSRWINVSLPIVIHFLKNIEISNYEKQILRIHPKLTRSNL